MRLSNQDRYELIEAILEEAEALDELSYGQVGRAMRRGKNAMGKRVAIAKWHGARAGAGARDAAQGVVRNAKGRVVAVANAGTRAKNAAGKKIAIGKFNAAVAGNAARDAGVSGTKAVGRHVARRGVEYTVLGAAGAGGTGYTLKKRRDSKRS